MVTCIWLPQDWTYEHYMMDEVDPSKDINPSMRSYRQLMVLGGIGIIFFSIKHC